MPKYKYIREIIITEEEQEALHHSANVLKDLIKNLNIYEINPMDALNMLNELKNKLK